MCSRGGGEEDQLLAFHLGGLRRIEAGLAGNSVLGKGNGCGGGGLGAFGY